jgi:FeS assembly protein SufD
MSLKRFNNINEIPVRTFKWLDVNSITLEDVNVTQKQYTNNYFENINQSGLTIQKTNKKIKAENYNGIDGKLLEDSFNNYNAGFELTLNKNIEAKDDIYINYKLDKINDVLIDTNVIKIEENSNVTVYMNVSAIEDKTFHQGHTNITVEKNAKLNIIMLQNLSDDSTNIQSIFADVLDGGNINFVLADIGSESSVVNINVNLLGDNSKSTIKSLYLGYDDKKIDLNYMVNHIGKETISKTITKGVLIGKSKKVFKGAIKFHKGAKGSAGELTEEVLLLSKLAKNSSIPLLLCDEDDVKGEHSASIGQLNEDILFYLMTRGLDEKEAKKMFLDCYFNPIIDLIKNDDLKDGLKNSIYSKVRDND